MYPRLKLLHKLLAEDGVIFISIDDNELYNLKAICDEVFGGNCFVSNISWQRTYSKRNDSKGIPAEIEHILVYSKQPMWIPKRLPRTQEMNENYGSQDGDPREWSSVTISAPGGATHQGMVYAIQHPITGEFLYPPAGRHWSFGQPQMFEYMNEWTAYELRPIDDFEKRCEICGKQDGIAPVADAIVLSKPLDEAKAEALARYEKGVRKQQPWPLLYFTANGKGGLRRKQYLDTSAGRVASNLWPHMEVGHTGEATNELASIFGTKSPFDTPKPSRLIERVLQIASDPDSIVLDSFAGSGTTAHAVLNMNKADGGNRKVILVEMGDYADTITAERVKRVIHGYCSGKNTVPGTGGSFSFYELGEPLLIDENLNENVSVDKIREYIWFMETKQPYTAAQGHPYYLGKHNDTGYYFYYEPQNITVLDYAFLSTIAEKVSGTVIYADRCSIGDDKLAQFGIIFKKIPRDISRL